MAEVRNLTEDLVAEILIKLPVKSLLRFRCVCRFWFDLINSPSFIQGHINHHKNDDNILIFKKHISLTDRFCKISFLSYESLHVILPDLEIPYYGLPGYYMYDSVCGPCDGLICISDGWNMVLCNPSMREFRMLPPLPYRGDLHRIGLGFDFITSDYKVVTFGYIDEDIDESGQEEQVHIYNLSTNSWRKKQCGSRVSFLSYSVPHSGSLCKGALHWLLEEKNTIFSFDLNNEVFRYMELPHKVMEGRNMHLTVLNESLVLFEYNDICSNLSLPVDIWIMHEYGVAESWTKDCTVGPLPRFRKPLLLWKNEAVIVDANKGLFLCDFENLEMNGIGIHDHSRFADSMIYRESLIRP